MDGEKFHKGIEQVLEGCKLILEGLEPDPNEIIECPYTPSIEKLAYRLELSLKGEKPEALSPMTNMILAYSIFGRDKEALKGRTKDDVLLHTHLLVKEMKQYRRTTRAQLKEIRDFSIRFAKETMVVQSEYFGSPKRYAA